MSGESARPVRSVTVLPTPEEAAAVRHGVVFYRLDVTQFSQVDAIGAVIGIYRVVTMSGPGKRAQAGTYEMRVGLRLKPDERGYYWVGFNHLAFGLMFEQAFRAAGQQRFRRPELPGGDPSRELPVVDVKELEGIAANLRSGRTAPRRPPASPFAELFKPEPKPTEPVPIRSPKQIRQDALRELTGNGGALAFLGRRRGRRRRGKGAESTGEEQS